jgi:hypothetical protein
MLSVRNASLLSAKDLFLLSKASTFPTKDPIVVSLFNVSILLGNGFGHPVWYVETVTQQYIQLNGKKR